MVNFPSGNLQAATAGKWFIDQMGIASHRQSAKHLLNAVLIGICAYVFLSVVGAGYVLGLLR